VDERLDLLNHRQVANLTWDDAPYVAKAIVACIRGKSIANPVYLNNVSMVHMQGTGINVYVLGEDWLKIVPYLADGTLNPNIVAYPIIGGDPKLDISTIDLQDLTLYQRVVGMLRGLFPTRFPTSKI